MAGTETTQGGHAALMDGVYRYQRYVYDATRKFYLLGRDRLIAGLDMAEGDSVLEVACGTGRNLAAIGRAHPQARLCGFDISSEMLLTARRNLDRAGMGTRATLAQGDATAFDPQALFGVPAFDRVVISYSLSMIPDWHAALAQALRHTAPGGSLHIVDFGGQTGLPAPLAAAQFWWLRKFHVAPRLDLVTAAENAAAACGATMHAERLYRDYAVLVRIARPPNDPT